MGTKSFESRLAYEVQRSSKSGNRLRLLNIKANCKLPKLLFEFFVLVLFMFILSDG